MKMDDRYEIRIVVVELRNGNPGNCYDNFEQFKIEHPCSPYRFGYRVFDTLKECIPDCCNDWNESVEEAIEEYRYLEPYSELRIKEKRLAAYINKKLEEKVFSNIKISNMKSILALGDTFTADISYTQSMDGCEKNINKKNVFFTYNQGEWFSNIFN